MLPLQKLRQLLIEMTAVARRRRMLPARAVGWTVSRRVNRTALER